MSVQKVYAQIGALVEPVVFQQTHCSIARNSPHPRACFITVFLLITVLREFAALSPLRQAWKKAKVIAKQMNACFDA